MQSADKGLPSCGSNQSDGLDLTGRVRPHFIRTNATGKRCSNGAGNIVKLTFLHDRTLKIGIDFLGTRNSKLLVRLDVQLSTVAAAAR